MDRTLEGLALSATKRKKSSIQEPVGGSTTTNSFILDASHSKNRKQQQLEWDDRHTQVSHHDKDHEKDAHKSNAMGSARPKSSTLGNPLPKLDMTTKNRIRSMFRDAKDMERSGRWNEACQILLNILDIDPRDSHSHLAYARIQSRREQNKAISNQPVTDSMNSTQAIVIANLLTQTASLFSSSVLSQIEPNLSIELFGSQARQAFFVGTHNCPHSIHLWQAWALHEESMGCTDNARFLFHKALALDTLNPYVCHALGLMEQRCGNLELAKELWSRPLDSNLKSSYTAALVCSLAELLILKGQYQDARDIYIRNFERMSTERETSEVYLAAAWLEERHYRNLLRAEELIHTALRVSPGNSRAQVALARLEGRKVDHVSAQVSRVNKSIAFNTSTPFLSGQFLARRNAVVVRRLEHICIALERKHMKKHHGSNEMMFNSSSEVKDGRLFNSWAAIEVKNGNFTAARDILSRGMRLFPRDHSIVQAAGKVEERLGNYTGARDFYSASLSIEPSAPTLVAYAMLELRNPESGFCNKSKVAKIFDEALLLDPRHGPVYNAYGNMELHRGNVDRAREIYKKGLEARCTAVASVYHGLAQLELSQGQVESARHFLIKGLKEVENQDVMMDRHQHDRATFLTHTLGMVELKCNQAAKAKEIFLNGIQRHGGSSQLLLGAALCELKLGNEDRAKLLFEQAVMADRKHAQAWQSWGVVEMRAGNYQVAKTLFECGIQSSPNHGDLWCAYGTMEVRRGNLEVARSLFAAGILKCSAHAPLYQAWACLELRCENFERAKILIGEALTRNKNIGSSWLVASKIEEKLGNGGLVGLILDRGLQCVPNDPELYRAKAESELKKGRIYSARNFLEKGLDIDPMHAPLYHSLAELEASVFNIDALARLNKKAAQIFNTNALVPMQSSAALRKKMKTSKRYLPQGFSTLLKELTLEVDLEDILASDPEKVIQSMSACEFTNL